MSDTLKPALTAEEWKSPKVMFRDGKYDEGYGIELIPTGDRRYFVERNTWAVVFDGSWAVAMADETRHRLAALALHGQPFGFTREDVIALRHLAELDVEDEGPSGYGWRSDALLHSQSLAASLAARIEALLPPEDSQ